MKQLLTPLVLSVLLGFATGTATPASDVKFKMSCRKCVAACTLNARKLRKLKGDPALIEKLEACAKACKEYVGGKEENEAECRAACTTCATACEQSGKPSLSLCVKYCRECAASYTP
jgi:hypothetical protein